MFSYYLKETTNLHYKDVLTIFSEVIAAYSENYIKPINGLCD
jgi:hypothetical protein